MKMCNMLCDFGGEIGEHNFGDKNNAISVHTDPANDALVLPEKFYTHCYIEPSDFTHMAMTDRATVIFHAWQFGTMFADQKSLDTGRLLPCDLHSNGQVKASCRITSEYHYADSDNDCDKPLEGFLFPKLFTSLLLTCL